MEGWHYGNAGQGWVGIRHFLPCASESGNTLGGVEQGFRGWVAKCDDDPRPDYLKLSDEITPAGGDFLDGWCSVVWGATLYDVADEDIIAGQAHGCDHFGQQLTCPANKRTAGHVFIMAWGFSDEYQISIGIALTEDGVGAGA